MIELISLHIPKCAGTALRQGLINAYGENAVGLDYDESPFNPASAASIDPEGHIEHYSRNTQKWMGWKVIHGHFYLPKYRSAAAPRITILRHPVERLISHYFYWKSYPRHNHLVHNYFLDNDLSIQDFAKLPSVRHFYSDVFLRGIDKAEFDFIGRAEDMQTGVTRIEKLIGKTISVQTINTNTRQEYAAGKREITDNPALMVSLHDILRKDILLYEKWC